METKNKQPPLSAEQTAAFRKHLLDVMPLLQMNIETKQQNFEMDNDQQAIDFSLCRDNYVTTKQIVMGERKKLPASDMFDLLPIFDQLNQATKLLEAPEEIQDAKDRIGQLTNFYLENGYEMSFHRNRPSPATVYQRKLKTGPENPINK